MVIVGFWPLPSSARPFSPQKWRDAMLLELNQEERELLLEVLRRRLDEAGVEEHRSEAWHYKEMVHHEKSLLERLHGKLASLAGEAAPTAPR
jgi:hypothetical protein